MKKWRAMVCGLALASCMSFPAFAAGNMAEYRQEAASVKQEIKEVKASMDVLRGKIKEESKQFNEERKVKKENKELKAQKEEYKQAKEKKQNIDQVRVRLSENSGQYKVLRAEAKVELNAGNYDAALDKMNKALEAKRESLKCLEDINGIWAEIEGIVQ